MRHLYKVSFYLEDEFPGHKYFSAMSYTRGHRWLSSREAHRLFGEPTTHYVPEGKYTLSIEEPGYETIERTVDVRGDVMLDTLRMRHKRITLTLQLQTENAGQLWGPVMMYVDGEDSPIVGDFDLKGQTAVFRNVPASSYYYLVEGVERGGGWYHSQVSFVRTWTETDTVAMYLDHSRRPFGSRRDKEKYLRDMVSNRDVATGDPDVELGELYYYDALLKYIHTWKIFPKADSLAYDCLRRAYHSDTLKYGYLYYPIEHLVWRNWDLKSDPTIRKPVVDSTCYMPMSEELWEKEHYDDYDLLTPFREAKEESDYRRDILSPMGEPSMVYPQREKPTVRHFCRDHHSGYPRAMRIDGDTLYVKEMFCTLDQCDPFDTTIDFNHPCPDTIAVEKHALTVAEQQTLRQLLEAIDSVAYRALEGPGLMETLSPTLSVIEYVLDGRYHCFCAYLPYALPPVGALLEWVNGLVRKEKK